MLSNWKLQEKSDRCGEYYEEYEYDGYTPEELEDIFFNQTLKTLAKMPNVYIAYQSVY